MIICRGMMKKLLVTIFCLLSIGTVFAHEETPKETPKKQEVVRSDEEELRYLNKQIDSLTDLKEYYRDKAHRTKINAQRRQFQVDSLRTESRQQFAQAKEYEEIANKIEKEIHLLEHQREVLRKKMGYPPNYQSQ